MSFIGNFLAGLVFGSAIGCLYEIWVSDLPDGVPFAVTPMVLVGAGVLGAFARRKFANMENSTE